MGKRTGFIKLHGETGITTFVRALFDTGAEANLMSAKCATNANLKQTKLCVEMEGITGREILDTGLVHARISPWFSSSEGDTLSKTFIVMKRKPMCQRYDFYANIPEFNNFTKADPYFNKRGNAQILFSVESWSDIIQNVYHSKVYARRKPNLDMQFLAHFMDPSTKRNKYKE